MGMTKIDKPINSIHPDNSRKGKKESIISTSVFTPPTVNNQKDMLLQLGNINHEFLEKHNYSYPEEK